MFSEHYLEQEKFFKNQEGYRSGLFEYNFSDETELRMFLDFCEISQVEGQKIFDVGAGFGRFTIPLLNLGAKVTASEISDLSLLLIKQNADLRGIGDHLKLIETTLEDPVFENVFDLTFCINVLHHVESPENVFRNMVKATAPGGTVAILEPNPFSPFFYPYFLWRGELKYEKGIIRCRKENLMKLFHQNSLSKVRYLPYGLIPAKVATIIPNFGSRTFDWRKTKFLSQFCMFHIISGVKDRE